MKEKFDKILIKLKKNFLLKILSLFFAIIVWIIIMNIIKPIVTNYINVPIDIENENVVEDIDKTYIVLDPRMCKIKYNISSEQSQLVRQSDFKVFVDLNDIMNTEYLPIHYNIQSEEVSKIISNIEIEPSTLHVKLGDLSRQDYRVKYNIKGSLGDGLTVGNVILSPTRVYISANEDIITNVSHIAIDIPLSNNDDSFSGVAKIQIIDKDGKEIKDQNIEVSTDEIKYTVSAFANKSLSVNAVVEGIVKKGYTYAGVQVYPNMLSVSGPRSTMDTLFSLDLPVINIDDLSENKNITYKISDILPAGLKCNSASEINVNVMVNDNIINKPSNMNEEMGPHIENTEGSNVISDS